MNETKNREDGAQTTAPVVVGLDGSEASLNALVRGVRTAEALHVPLLGITAWRYPHGYIRYPATSYSPPESAHAILAEAQRRAFVGEPPEWCRFEAREGSPARVLLDASRSARMLVVGTRGHGGFTGLLLGSVSSACAEYAQCPVLIDHAG